MRMLSQVVPALDVAASWFLYGRRQSAGGHPVVETLKSASGIFYLTLIMLLLIQLVPSHVLQSSAGLFVLTAVSLLMLRIMRRVSSMEWREAASVANLATCSMMALCCITTVASHPPSRSLAVVCILFMMVAVALLVRGLEGFKPRSDD